jgi:hypothetical protein
MASGELQLDLLLGKRVLDPSGKPVGRLEEARAERRGDDWVVTEYLIGGGALLERLSAWGVGLALLRLLGGDRAHASSGYVVPWDQLDLDDPKRPRLRCPLHELATFDERRREG